VSKDLENVTEQTALWRVVERYLAAERVDLDDLDARGTGHGRVVRVTVDSPDGIHLDRIAELSRGLSRLLDEEDAVDGPYTLEVSSPGLERRLRRPEHFRKAVGREVIVKTASPVDGARSHRGMLESADEDGIVVGVSGGARRISLGDVTQARTVFRWERTPKPGRRRGSA
jgi:ribosome maturation factor RimP